MRTPGDREDTPGSGHVRVEQTGDARRPLSVDVHYDDHAGFMLGDTYPDPEENEAMTHRKRVTARFEEGADLDEGVSGRTAFGYTRPEAMVAGIPGKGPEGSPLQYEQLHCDE